MNKTKTIRAWKDEEYRNSLSDEERKALPDHPAGVMDLSEEELSMVSGQGDGTTTTITIIIASLEACPSAEGSCDWGTEGCCGEYPA